MAVKVNPRSEIGRVGLIVRVGGTNEPNVERRSVGCTESFRHLNNESATQREKSRACGPVRQKSLDGPKVTLTSQKPCDGFSKATGQVP